MRSAGCLHSPMFFEYDKTETREDGGRGRRIQMLYLLGEKTNSSCACHRRFLRIGTERCEYRSAVEVTVRLPLRAKSRSPSVTCAGGGIKSGRYPVERDCSGLFGMVLDACRCVSSTALSQTLFRLWASPTTVFTRSNPHRRAYPTRVR